MTGQRRDLESGMMVGEYQIDGVLGEGGMGKVFAATHPVIAKKAAIKVLHPELSVNREAVERFVQEARSVNQIGHPNIVDIFSFGNLPDGRCYFVMEWLRGQSLRDRLRNAGLPLADALSILETITIALEAAHEKGIVHRDLKPDNIFLVEVKGVQTPTVKLLDFGIAKLLGTDGDRVERTRAGSMLGTPAYMSPEQVRGQMVDHRTDIYALGALSYELFTGSVPFPAESAAEMLAKHMYEAPPSARVKNPHVPPSLDALVQRMLSKDPNGRPTLEHARAELHAFRAGGAVGTAPTAYAQPTGQGPSVGTQGPRTGASGPMITPYPATAHPQTTPAPGVMSVQAAGPSGMTTGMTTSAPKPRSQATFYILSLLFAGGIGTAVFFAVLSRSENNAAQPAAAPTQPAVGSGDKTVPRDPTPPPTPTPTPTPTEVAKPVEATKPAEPPPPPPPPTEVAKPTEPTPPTEAAKPPEPKKTSTRKSGSTKKSTQKSTTTPGTTGGDDDAPM